MKPFLFAASLAFRFRFSLYGAVRRKDKRPLRMVNSIQPVSGSASSWRHSAGVLRGIGGKAVFKVGIVGTDMDKGFFLVKGDLRDFLRFC